MSNRICNSLSNRLRFKSALTVVSIFTFWLVQQADAQVADRYETARKQMVNTAVIGSGVKHERVIQSMLKTPRHEFVPTNIRNQAYFDMALPIGGQQTISAPFIVAYMTEALDPKATDKVLEIGTGSGYQAAVLSPLVRSVYSIEIVEELGYKAKATLNKLKYDNVKTKVGDGFKGWPEYAPFDKIIVTCSPARVPIPLVQQLREGGTMVIPVGQRYQQTMYIMRKTNGELKSEALRPTLFVPMTGNAEDNRQVKPDPLNPMLFNGDFELVKEDYDFLIGWYYQRQVKLVSGNEAAQGDHFAQFSNETPGLSSHMLQGFAIDGRAINSLGIQAQIKLQDVRQGRTRDEIPLFAISFYDESRREVGVVSLGPFIGTHNWSPVQKIVRVPIQAREAILRVGLFGGGGEFSIDDLQLRFTKR